MENPQNPQKTIYIKPSDSELFTRLASENDNNLSESLALLVREKYKDPGKMRVQIQYLFSQKYRKECAKKGVQAPEKGELVFDGPVPEIFLDMCNIGEFKTIICLHLCRIEKVRQCDDNWIISRTNYEFDNVPTLEKLIEVYQNYLVAEAQVVKEVKTLNEKSRAKKEKWADAREAEKAEREAEREAREEQENEAWADQREWGLSHGTDLLKGRISEGLNWHDLSETEFAIQACAGIDLDDVTGEGEDTTDYLNPTQGELEQLREVRACLKGGNAICSLQIVTYREDDGESPPDEWENVEICVEIKCPSGGESSRYFLILEKV